MANKPLFEPGQVLKNKKNSYFLSTPSTFIVLEVENHQPNSKSHQYYSYKVFNKSTNKIEYLTELYLHLTCHIIENFDAKTVNILYNSY